ncbi:unnamed protein product, partial [Sphenostylis stenocarpa]
GKRLESRDISSAIRIVIPGGICNSQFFTMKGQRKLLLRACAVKLRKDLIFLTNLDS